MTPNRRLFESILSIKRKCQEREDIIEKDLGISQSEFNGLIVLNDDESIQGMVFAARMGLSPSRSSRVLNKLHVRGFVHTVLDPGDRRSVSISLTPGGKSMKKRIFSRMQECENRICANLDETHILKIKNALNMLEQVL